jgi:hypothetical protein
MPTYLNIPVSLCVYSLKRKQTAYFQLFCWLKTQCNSHFKLDNALTYKGIIQLEITRQTLLNRLNWLLKNKWIGLNTKTKNYHINSFKVIHRRTHSEILSGVLWYAYDFKNFQAFVAAVVLYHIARKKRWYEKELAKERFGKKVSARMYKTRSHKSNGALSFFLPLTYAAKALKTDTSNIRRLKKMAHQANFLQAKNNFKPVSIPIEEIKLVRKYYPESHKLVIRDKVLCKQLPDKIVFNIHFKRKSNLKQTIPTKQHRY